MLKKSLLFLGLLAVLSGLAAPFARPQKQVRIAFGCCSPPPVCPGSPGCPEK